ncbi:hypothetical protein MGU_03631 [Metarhizium guizhouense ARSEF 977]|uniref:Uncharacterized protein n=1 Tax=Metarhizium guizhouense (strain ARSEF 977) TaxID=1276136 RepID=A0A0B4I8B2_METGA|nr:hypothetical protein MGU_03631 [Metarhizium guizhouense ARSEF 977]
MAMYSSKSEVWAIGRRGRPWKSVLVIVPQSPERHDGMWKGGSGASACTGKDWIGCKYTDLAAIKNIRQDRMEGMHDHLPVLSSMSMLRVGVSCNVTLATAPDSDYSHRFIVAFVKVDLVDDGQAMLELRLDDDATLYRDLMARLRTHTRGRIS